MSITDINLIINRGLKGERGEKGDDADITYLPPTFAGYENPSVYPLGKSIYELNIAGIAGLQGITTGSSLYVITERIDTLSAVPTFKISNQYFYETASGKLVASRTSALATIWGAYEFPEVNTPAFSPKSSYTTGSWLATMRGMTNANRSFAMTLVGDSTGAGAGKWVDRFVQDFATKNPQYQVNFWNRSPGSTGAWTLTKINAGTEDRGLSLPNPPPVSEGIIAGNEVQFPQNGNVFAIEAKIKVNDFSLLTGGAIYRIWNNSVPSAQFATIEIGSTKAIWVAFVDGAGTFRFPQASTAVPYNNGDTFWVRAEVNCSLNQITYKHRASDTGAWITISTGNVQGAANYRIIPNYNQDTSVAFMPRGGLTTYRLNLFDNLDVNSACLSMPPIDHVDVGDFNSTAFFVGKPTFTIFNMSLSGYGVRNYLTSSLATQYVALNSPTSFPNRDVYCVANLISLGHNQNSAIEYAPPQSFSAGIRSIFNHLQSHFPWAERVRVLQNPALHSQMNRERGALRMARLIQDSALDHDGILNVYKSFLDAPLPLSSYLEADNLHPNNAGNTLWAKTLIDELDQA